MRASKRGGFSVSAAAEPRHAKPVRFVEDASARTRAVTLEDVPEFVEERKRRANEERARAIANGGVALGLAWSVACRVWEAWRRRRDATRANAEVDLEADSDSAADSAAEAEAETRASEGR